MARNTISIAASPAAVFAVFADAYTYENWVVGCKEIRAVDDAWPAPSTKFHHKVGIGPLTTADYTEVTTIDPPRLLVLRARARPFGTAKVTFEVSQEHNGAAVVIIEGPLSPWARRLWNPLLDRLTHTRNTETLRRLKKQVEERATIGS